MRKFTTYDWTTRVNSFIRDTRDPGYTFTQNMTREDRDHMDALLVRDRHPLAQQAGTQEARFRALVSMRHQFYL